MEVKIISPSHNDWDMVQIVDIAFETYRETITSHFTNYIIPLALKSQTSLTNHYIRFELEQYLYQLLQNSKLHDKVYLLDVNPILNRYMKRVRNMINDYFTSHYGITRGQYNTVPAIRELLARDSSPSKVMILFLESVSYVKTQLEDYVTDKEKWLSCNELLELLQLASVKQCVISDNRLYLLVSV